ncbi:rhomboid family intramembrane serine protease [Chitinophaga sp. SYP-B3965]|uniref:rhomboid family intramembrane serine protease n=1 Tax=Chitinophaga sp. SYP-B3965 TaxID=2663120 RepID=UPI00156533FA|nr:rhomboid family intramembrane serine protease [Chitinophaga sp. SYP-B3965]
MAISITLIIIIFTCLISITAFNKPDQINKLSFWPYMIHERNEWYRFLTGGFVHNDFMHLGFNMLTLWFFGNAMEVYYEHYFGSKLFFVILYVLGLILPGVSTYFRQKDNIAYRAVGASGAVSAVLFSIIIFDPWMLIQVFFIPMPAIVFGVLYLAYSWYMAKRGGDNIGHDVHFWGAVLGLIFPIILKPELGLLFIEKLLSKF